MVIPPQEHVTALLTASRKGDAVAVANIWRELTPGEQERVLVALLGMQTDPTTEASAVEPDDRTDPPTSELGEIAVPEGGEQTQPIPKLVDDLRSLTGSEQTQPIPKLVEDLQELTGPESDAVDASAERPATSTGRTDYWARWLRRWKWSALVAAWAVTTIFAFTGEVAAFGPMEWFVALFGTVVGGGVLVGTLLNFVVAAIATRPPRETPNHQR